MGRTLILTIALFCGLSASSPTQDPKIIGGEEVTIEDVPYQLQMQWLNLGFLWPFQCGATIIGKDIALTAGHCAEGFTPQRLRFQAGNETRGEGSVHNVTAFAVHPEYKNYGGYADYDIAVFKVSPAFEFSNTTRAVAVIEKTPAAGDIGTLSGWGSITGSSGPLVEILRKTDVPIADFEECKAAYAAVGLTGLTDRMLCAGYKEGGKNGCSGDGGGPLVVDGKVAGLLSWSYGCAVAGFPSVFTDVAKFAPWIEEAIAGFSK